MDLVSIIPAFLGLFKITSLSTAEGLRALNLIKIIRLGKISRAYWESQQNSNTEQRVNVTNTAIYFLSLFSSVIMTGALMHLTEGHQHVYSSIPLAMLQTAKILIGGITFAPATTLAGELSTLASRFLGLALFGLLVSVIGDSLRRMLFGKSVKSHGGATHKHPESHSSAENKRHDSSKPHA